MLKFYQQLECPFLNFLFVLISKQLKTKNGCIVITFFKLPEMWTWWTCQANTASGLALEVNWTSLGSSLLRMSICEHQDEYSPRHTHISLQRMLKIWGFYLRHIKPRNNHMYFKQFLWGLIDPTYVKLLTYRRHSLNNNHHRHSSCQLAGLIRYQLQCVRLPLWLSW